MNHEIHTADGLTLRLHLWDAAAAARGQVVIVHGLGEHGGRYAPVARALNAHGWRVVAYDQRGHGASEGPRGGIAEAHSLLADLGRVLDVARAAFAGPLVLLGHSMGGLVAARFVAESMQASPRSWARPVEGLVLSSPALDLGLRTLQKLAMAVVPRVAPALALGNGLDPHWISRDPAVVQAYLSDPLVHDRISGRLAGFMAEAGPQVLAAAPHWRLPTLLMWAGADRCVAPAGSAALASAAPPTMVTAREWPGLSHEIFNEPEHEEVMAALDAWLDPRFPSGV